MFFVPQLAKRTNRQCGEIQEDIEIECLDTVWNSGNVQRSDGGRGIDSLPHLNINQVSCQILTDWYDWYYWKGNPWMEWNCKDFRQVTGSAGGSIFISLNDYNQLQIKQQKRSRKEFRHLKSMECVKNLRIQMIPQEEKWVTAFSDL